MNCEEVAEDIDVLLQDPEAGDIPERVKKHFQECEKCRTELGDLINTAAKISEVGTISDFIDVSDEFIERTREEARKESDRFQVNAIPLTEKKSQKFADYLIIAMIIGTVIAAIIIFWLAVIFL